MLAGAMHVFVPRGWLERQLGQSGAGSGTAGSGTGGGGRPRRRLLPILKASALGLPLPLCSCAVIPVAACLWAPVIHSFEGVFDYIQELWGFVSAPTCAIFAVGLWRPRASASAAKAALIVGPLLYLVSRAPSWIWTVEEAEAAGGLLAAVHAYSSMSFLYHMFVLFLVLVGLMLWMERRDPLPEPCVLPDRAVVDLTPHPRARLLGGLVLAATGAMYATFW